MLSERSVDSMEKISLWARTEALRACNLENKISHPNRIISAVRIF